MERWQKLLLGIFFFMVLAAVLGFSLIVAAITTRGG